MALSVEMRGPIVCPQLIEERTHFTHFEFSPFDPQQNSNSNSSAAPPLISSLRRIDRLTDQKPGRSPNASESFRNCPLLMCVQFSIEAAGVSDVVPIKE